MALLEVKDLKVVFETAAGPVYAVNGLSFSLEKGEVLGLVGESGSGKSVTAYSLLGILEKNGRITGGSVRFRGQELVGAPERVLRQVRGNRISMVFQDPMTSLNPVYTVGHQLTEAIGLHTGRGPAEARRRALEMLRLVKVNEPEKRLKQYPHSLSGGLRQRVMIAMALACEPDLLIADEPTTALDVTVQAQILELIRSLQQELGLAVLMITHDLGVVARLCQRVMVLYAGTVCEQGTVEQLFYRPRHAYTQGLLDSLPTPERQGPLRPIPGTPADLHRLPRGCPFAPRCRQAMVICLRQRPEPVQTEPGHWAACWADRSKSRRQGGKQDE